MSGSRSNTGYTDEALVKALTQAAEKLGHTPTRNEFDELIGPSSNTVTNHFGTWNAGLMAAGLPLHTVHEDDVPIPEDVILGSRGSYRDGYKARLIGKPIESCPYETNIAGHQETWRRGWREADQRVESESADIE